MTEVLGLTLEQHTGLGQLLSRSNDRTRSGSSSQRPALYPGVARVLCLGDVDPVYTPKAGRDAAVFRYYPDGVQTTVELSGADLAGRLDITVGDVSVTVDCQVDTEGLRAALGFSLRDCRATVFPAYWELDFNGGRFAKRPPIVSVVPYEPEEGSEETAYNGGLRVLSEGWVSMSSDGDGFETIQTTDWVPHLSGAVKAGSIGAAVWSHNAGWLVLAWQCREWSFAS